MSGFDSNPFAEPASANPFADPAVTQYTGQTATASAASAGLEEYNPFADGDLGRSTVAAPVNPVPFTTPLPAAIPQAVQQIVPPPAPVVQPMQQPPAYIEPAQTYHQDVGFPGENDAGVPMTGMVDDSSDLIRTEPAPNTTATDMSAAQQLELARRDPNFPPLPSCCPVKPCFYHNIQLEIPSTHCRLVKFLFIYWEMQVFSYFFNMIALLALFADTGDYGGDFGFSLLWFFLFSPCSFVCWYHCAYKAFKNDSSLRFMWFFLTFSCQCIYNGIQAVGFLSSGSCGLILVLEAKSQAHSGTFFLGIAAFVIWTLLTAFGVYLLYKLHRYYRSSGHSIERVQNEAGTALAKNEGVRSAVVTGVKATF